MESIDKVKDKKKKTPYQRKYKKTYNSTWEVNKPICYNIFREAKKMILQQ
jgi:hypothetical protein